MCSHRNAEPLCLPPLPKPGEALAELDEQVVAYAMSEPRHILEMAAARHTGLSRLGKRPPPAAAAKVDQFTTALEAAGGLAGGATQELGGGLMGLSGLSGIGALVLT